MLAHSCRRVPASVRHYASHVAVASKKTQKSSQQTQKPAPPPSSTPPVSLQTRLYLAHNRNWEKREGAPKPLNEESEELDSMSEEEKSLKMVERFEEQREWMKSRGLQPPTLTLPLLDHMIPYSVGFRARSEYASALDMWHQFQKNRINDGKNAFSMRHIAAADSFPGIHVDPSLGWFRSIYLYASHAFQAQSLKPTAWIAPMRQEILEQYIQLNQAIVHCVPSNPKKRLGSFVMEPYMEEVIALAQQRKRDILYRWNFHREVTPTRILSLRAGDGEFSKVMPETGSRIAIQALVRFDTEQSVELYDTKGRALHVPAPTAAPQPAKFGKTLYIVPAVPKRVTEYLVVDKAFYVPDSKWKFRARFVPEPGRTVAV